MAWSASNGTLTATIPTTCTFSNGSANITVTSTAAVNDMVSFTTTGTLPTNFAAGTTYYVLSNSGTVITVSATKGGSAVVAGSAGSGTHTVTFEHVVSEPTTIATYEASFDLVNMANVDLVEFRMYDMVDGSNYREIWKGTYQHNKTNLVTGQAKGAVCPAKAVTTQAKFTICQQAGTGRAFPYSIRSI